MSGARTRRQAALAAAADDTPIKAAPEPAQEQHVVVNGNGSARASSDGVAKTAQPTENIFFFIPNLIGTQKVPALGGSRCGPHEASQRKVLGSSSTRTAS